MCGIVGMIDQRAETPADELGSLVTQMASALQHRGPDSAGCWLDADRGIALGHRRLEVLDLSPTGAQPMTSSDGRHVITYNGELYNHVELRRDLEARDVRFRGTSDTEVLLEAVVHWGVERTLEVANGMFAFGLWDAVERRLELVRDRLGEKPLYWAVVGHRLAFASELTAMMPVPGIDRTIDRGALASYFRLGYIAAPHTIYTGVQKLAAGCRLTIDAGEGVPRVRQYWSLRDVAQQGLDRPFSGTDRDALERLDGLLRDATALRLRADVPVGVFLSGGIDSSLLTALAMEASAGTLRTFTVGFAERSHDEAASARAIATRLGTDHTAMPVTSDDVLALIDEVPGVYGEPFADPAAIPMMLICRLARESVTVGLSGDGGDEVFAGYNRLLGVRAWEQARRLPRRIRMLGSRALMAPRPATVDRLFEFARRDRPRNPGEKVQKLAILLGAESDDEIPRRLLSIWPDPSVLVDNSDEPRLALGDRAAWLPRASMSEQVLYLDGVTTLPDGMLTKADRASMASSLELRVPYLDHRVVELAWHFPWPLKVRDGHGKWPLRTLLARHVPTALFDRPKMGLDPPIASFLRDELRISAQERLSPDEIRAGGLLRAEPIQACLREHLAGRHNWDYRLWTVLVLQTWLAQEAARS